MKTATRTLRLTAATAAALVLMTGAAQAHPLAINTGKAEAPQMGVVYTGTYRPTAPAPTVTLAPDRVDRIGVAPQITRVGDLGAAVEHRALAPLGGATDTRGGVTTVDRHRAHSQVGTIVVHSTSTSDGFDWSAALIGAGSALLIVLIVGGGGMTLRGRRNVALSS